MGDVVEQDGAGFDLIQVVVEGSSRSGRQGLGWLGSSGGGGGCGGPLGIGDEKVGADARLLGDLLGEAIGVVTDAVNHGGNAGNEGEEGHDWRWLALLRQREADGEKRSIAVS